MRARSKTFIPRKNVYSSLGRNLRTAGLQAGLRSDFCVHGCYEIQNHVNDGVIAHRGIDHSVVNGAIRPFDAEIPLDEISAFPIHRIHQFLCFILALAARKQTMNLVFSRSIQKHAESIWPASEKVLRSTSDDYRIPGFRGVLN